MVIECRKCTMFDNQSRPILPQFEKRYRQQNRPGKQERYICRGLATVKIEDN